MKAQGYLIAVTAVNLVLAGCLLRPHAAPAQGQVQAQGDGVAPVLRGRALEIVDEQGKVRASITVYPPSERVEKSTVVLRLIDPNGRPEVKIAASEKGGVMSLVGESDTMQVLLQADGDNASLKLANKDGKQQFFKP
jgi:hypothetical protein